MRYIKAKLNNNYIIYSLIATITLLLSITILYISYATFKEKQKIAKVNNEYIDVSMQNIEACQLREPSVITGVVKEEEAEQVEKESDNVKTEEKVIPTEQIKKSTAKITTQKADENIETSKTEKKQNKTTKVIVTAENTNKKVVVQKQYRGFEAAGYIQIPKTNVSMPIISKTIPSAMEFASCILYSTGKLNKSGNTLIVGHNYRNGTLFSENDKLQIGDKIYITDLEQNKREYTIYSTFMTTPEDVSFLKRKVTDKPEITISTCSDDELERFVILAK